MTNAKNERPILLFVLGMHRSGTSALTGVLTKLGFKNAEDLMAANEFNASGYWEASRAVQINEDLMESHGSYWFDPWPLNVEWDDAKALGSMHEQIQEFLLKEFAGSDFSVLKDPRICRTFPLWRKAADEMGFDVRCLMICRHPAEVAQSLKRRDGMSEAHASALWTGYLLDAERYSRGLLRTSIQYDDLLADWEGTLSDALKLLDIDKKVSSDEASEEIGQFLSEECRHHYADALFSDAGAADAAMATSLYETLRWDEELESTSTFEYIFARWIRSRGYLENSTPEAYAKSFPTGMQALIRNYFQRGDVAAAVQALKTCDDDFLRHPQLVETAAQLLIVNGKAGLAERILKSSSDVEHSALRQLYLAIAQTKAGKTQDALVSIDRSLELDPDNPSAWRQLGILQAGTDDLSGAEASFTKGLELKPGDADLSSLLAQNFMSQGQQEKAIQTIRGALEANPGHGRLMLELGEALLAHADPAGAREVLEACVQKNKNVPRAFHALSKALNRTGQPAEALEAAERSVDLATGSAAFRNHYGNMLLANGFAGKAMQAQEVAIESRPNHAQFRADHAAACVQAGADEKALASISKAVELAPKSALFRFRMGNIKKRLGETEGAIEAYRNAVELAPENEKFRAALDEMTEA